MNINKILRRRIRERIGDVDFAGDVNAVVAANVNESSSTTKVSSHQTVVQRSGKKQDDIPETNPPGID
jgi:hypothetical protein